MRKAFVVFVVVLFAASLGAAQSGDGLKVFISVDMEGVTGVVHWEECSRKGMDYDLFRKIMTQEANAAIQGALDAGATEIVVKDSHGSGRNILPHLLNPHAKLHREWTGTYLSMMAGITKEFDAIIFIGYHAKAGTLHSPLAHTMSGNVIDVSINGVSLPEAGINALIGGSFDVPIVFLSGGREICKQAKSIFGTVETVKVKDGEGNSNMNLHPEVTQAKIRSGVWKALMNLENYKPYKLSPPFKMVLKVKKEKELYQNAVRVKPGEITFTSNDIRELLTAFEKMY